jgi:hypothetical protein
MIACKRIFYGGALHVRGAAFEAADDDVKQLLKGGSARVPLHADQPVDTQQQAADATSDARPPRGRYRRRDLLAEK